MSNTFVQDGKVLTLTAPTGGVTAGTPLFHGALFVVPRTTAAQTVSFDADVEGVHALAKTASQAWAQGQRIYWDTANSKADSSPNVGPYIGVASQTIGSGSGETTGYVKLDPFPVGSIQSLRTRVTTAEVNAGKVLVPAIAGRRYRLIDAAAIAYGGAVGAVTTVDLLGTVTTDRKLVAFGQANLTQSTMVRAGGTGGTLLADGASFTQNDANAALKVGITGSNVTTATGIDFLITYAIDPA